MYNNIDKRCILIFPKFKNIDLIQKIRNKYDPLANLIAPHITLAFPFSDDISNKELISKLNSLLKNFKPFTINFKGVSLSHDNYIFLNCVKGSQEIIQLHDEIYNKILPNHLNKSIKYIPHITLGQSSSIEKQNSSTCEFESIVIEGLNSFTYEFESIVDDVSIELIGKNEESILIKTINLGG